jgi:hypothetical protein
LPHVDQVEHSYGIAAAIADVGVLAIIRWIADIALASSGAERDQDQQEGQPNESHYAL